MLKRKRKGVSTQDRQVPGIDSAHHRFCPSRGAQASCLLQLRVPEGIPGHHPGGLSQGWSPWASQQLGT